MNLGNELQADIWAFVKGRRDALATAQREYEEAQELLRRMKSAGLDSHLPTIEEAQAAWRGE